MIPFPSSPRPPRVLVLGAGWLGGALAEQLAADGIACTTVRRTLHDPPAGGRALQLDIRSLADPAVAVPAALEGHELVIALVAPARQAGDDHASTYPAAARAAARVATAIGARALCWVSSTGVYGHRDGREVFETTAVAPADASQRALLEAEQAALGAATPALRVGVLRVAGLYGPGRDPAPRYRDLAGLTGRFGHWVNLAWRDDVLSAITTWCALALGPTAPPSLLNVADGTPLTVGEVASLVARADGRPAPRLDTPPGAATVPASPPVAGPARSNQRVRVDALRALGWRPTVPTLRDGLRRLGYVRLADERHPYGPQTAAVRSYLQRLASCDAATHDRIVAEWAHHRGQPHFQRAERRLGEVMARSGREADRDAAAGPLLQVVRRAAPAPDPSGDAVTGAPVSPALDDLDPIAEPALAALMAIVVRDLLTADDFSVLTGPVAVLDPGLLPSPSHRGGEAVRPHVS